MTGTLPGDMVPLYCCSCIVSWQRRRSLVFGGDSWGSGVRQQGGVFIAPTQVAYNWLLCDCVQRLTCCALLKVDA